MLSGLKRIISKYSNNYTIIDRLEGSYVDGRWVEGTATETELEGAVVPLSANDLEIAEKGTYTEDDRKLYSANEHDIGQIVIHKDKEYKIHKKRDYSDWSGIRIYIIKREGVAND